MDDAVPYPCPDCGQSHPRSIDVCPLTGCAVPEVFRLVGEVIDGKYEVGARLGEGGMGVVYEARHLAIGRKLAIKFLKVDGRTDARTVGRFQNEARIAASVRHRNIVDMIDMGEVPGKYNYIVMEHLVGADLGSLIQSRGKLDVAEALEIIVQVLDGLRAAHARGVVHRDLKPENIFVGSGAPGDGCVKILDFGISRLIRDGRERSAYVSGDGTLVGTPCYMSPEQAVGSKKIDPRADLYSVGAVLFEMLTGVPPFDGENANDILISIMQDSPPDLADLVPGVPEGLSVVILKALAKAPGERYQSAGEFIHALVPYGAGSVRPTAPAGAPDASGKVAGPKEKGKPPPAVHDGPAGRGRVAKAAVLLAASLAMVVSALLVLWTYGRGLGGDGGGMEVELLSREPDGGQRPGGPAAGAKALPDTAVWMLSIAGLPGPASVFIDDVLHKERPILVRDSVEPHDLRIEVGGNVLVDQRIWVRGDTVMSFGPSKTKLVKSGGDDRTRAQPTLPAKAGGPSKDSIDRLYPEM